MNKKQQRQQKMLRQQEIVNAAKEAGRDLTAEEQTEFDSLQREIERLNGEIEAEEQQQRGMNPPANAPPQNPANPEADTQRAIQEERARIRSITELCGEFGMEARSFSFGVQKLYRERCDTGLRKRSSTGARKTARCTDSGKR